MKEKELKAPGGERNSGLRQSSATVDGIEIRISKKAYVLLFTLILAPGLICGGVLLGRMPSLVSSKTPSYSTRLAAPTNRILLNPGPWGTIECVPFRLEIPEEFLSLREDEKSEHRWYFGNANEQTVTEFLKQVALRPDEKEQLLQHGKWEPRGNGVYLAAPKEVILSMSPEARQQIYSTLAKFPENIWQREEAYNIPVEDLGHHFESSGLSAETVALVKKLLYPRGKLMVFSDVPTVLGILNSPQEKLLFEKVLSRRPTMLLKLHVAPGSDVNALINYWGRAGRVKDLRPLLEALSKTPQGAIVDVTHLLPPMPSARIFTYPYPSLNQPENCHWTSFNFFRDPPEGAYSDLPSIQNKLASDYYPVFSDPRYGDVVFLTKPNSEIIHSCVYIADQVVYTKNGGHFSAPWMFMRLESLLSSYSTFVAPNEEIKVVYYRNKYY